MAHPARRGTITFPETGIKMLDLRGTPILTCICGSKMFIITVMWDDETREVSWYDLRQECRQCGAISTAPTPIDWKD
jgi:hypothetical protein